MSENGVIIRNSGDLSAINDIRIQEIARILFNLKQRFDTSSDYRRLVSSLKYFETPLVKQNRHVKINTNMEEYIQEAANVAELKEVMEYQLEVWSKIRELTKLNEKASIIVSAETGMGKTEAVLPAIVNEVINSDVLAIFIFPRKALLKDQLQRIAKYNHNIVNNSNKHSSKTPLRFAVQMSGVSEKLYWTAYSDTSIDESIQKDYDIESEFLRAKYIDDQSDKLSLLDIRCPLCEQNLEWEFRFKKHPRGYGRDSRNVQANHFRGNDGFNHLWKCPQHDDVKISISLSREDHIASNPNIVFTTIDSLESLLLDPVFGKNIIDKAKYVVLDEVHTYNGIYGAHASSIINELTNELKSKPLFVGLSATITEPEKFATNLFGTSATNNYVISPSKSDRAPSNQSTMRKFLFIKSKFHEQRYYPMKSQVMIQSALLLSSSLSNLQNQSLVFMDSIDAVTRLKNQSEDAYNNLHLHNLRLDGLINGNTTFDARGCLGFAPYKCSNTCYVYEQGECWALTQHRSGIANASTTINILGVTASSPHSRLELMNSSLIYSTSELELGIDLPNISNLFQYGSPYSVTSFIQRVGRAGRGQDREPLIGVILGEKTTDYIYFRKGSDILLEPLSTPLNNKNEVIRNLHHELLEISKKAIKEFFQDVSSRKEYVKEITNTWKTILDEFGPIFQREMDKLGIQQRLITKSGWDDIKVFKSDISILIDKKIDELKRKIEEFLGNNQEDPREDLRNKSAELFSLLSGIGIDITDASEKVELFLSEYNIPPEQRDLETKKTVLKASLNELLRSLTYSNVGKGELFKKFGDLFTKLEKDVDLTETTTDEIRKLFYRIQFYNELRSAFGKSSLIEIVKDALRARYFLNVSENFFVQELVPFPQNFFELTRYYCIIKQHRANDTEKISIDQVLFRYFPFRVNYNPNNNYGEVVLPTINVTNNGLSFSTDSYLDYILLSDPIGERFAFPRLVTFDRYQTEPIYGLLKYCDHCHRFYSFRWRGNCESCGARLQDTRVYSTSNVESFITSNEWSQKTYRTYISDTATLTRKLNGVSLTLTPALIKDGRYILASKRAVDMNIQAEIPVGYSIKTCAVKISIRKESIDAMIREYNLEFPAISTRLSRDKLEEIALHTISHLWILLCSEYSQVSANSFSYDWRTENDTNFIYISENQEGGAGFLEEVFHFLQFSPKKIYDSMVSISNCDQHLSISSSSKIPYGMVNSKDIYDWIRFNLPSISNLSDRQQIMQEYADLNKFQVDEVMNEYPTCIDGCESCIAIGECKSGGGIDQLDHISLKMAQAYITSITKLEKNKDTVAELVKRGMKVIEEIDAGNGGYLILDI